MTPALPAMATFSEIVSTALRAATHRVSEGSQRNAMTALEARYDMVRQSHEVMAAFQPAAFARPGDARVARHRSSA